jgi:hypothetical protein
MASFEMTDRGIVAVGADDDTDGAFGGGVTPGGAFLNQIRAQGREQRERQAPVATQRRTAPIKPGDVVGAARARIREIKATLRDHARLQRELTELQRLVAAAKQKPRASIRAIDSARRAG